jgi:hypothetical protein
MHYEQRFDKVVFKQLPDDIFCAETFLRPISFFWRRIPTDNSIAGTTTCNQSWFLLKPGPHCTSYAAIHSFLWQLRGTNDIAKQVEISVNGTQTLLNLTNYKMFCQLLTIVPSSVRKTTLFIIMILFPSHCRKLKQAAHEKRTKITDNFLPVCISINT